MWTAESLTAAGVSASALTVALTNLVLNVEASLAGPVYENLRATPNPCMRIVSYTLDANYVYTQYTGAEPLFIDLPEVFFFEDSLQCLDS